MIKAGPVPSRDFVTRRIDADLVVAGGGLAGVCAAITAARAGAKVALIQDRPVLGGNASSEVRLWALGATSHMGNNNRWAREGGVIDEILVENTFRNPEGNTIHFDTVLLEKVVEESNITLLLNTAVIEVTKSDDETIASVRAFCSQNSTMFDIFAPLFCDASGDGVVGFLSGAAFRMGAESADEFGEKFAPSREYGELLGHSIYFLSKDTGRPVRFVPPSYALRDITRIPRYKTIRAGESGCRLWWIEYGGRLDTVHDTEEIKWELWKVVYGVWDYIKNSGEFPGAETLALEWVGTIPGKRESRRFEGPVMLSQRDVIEQRQYDDAVAFGGWSLDLHPADGVYSGRPGCNQWHPRGIYGIPYRCYTSRAIWNLFLAGRCISASHVAFGSTRVMLTCAHGGQAVGMAAALCAREGLLPADLNEPGRMRRLQRALLRAGQHIPGFSLDDPDDLAPRASLAASSRLRLAELPPDGGLVPLTDSIAQMIPVPPGRAPSVTFLVSVSRATVLRIELRSGDRPDNHTPDRVLGVLSVDLQPGDDQPVAAVFDAVIDGPRYLFYCLMSNEHVAVRCSARRVTGLLSVSKHSNPAVSNFGAQVPPGDIGVEAFEFWTPSRRPGGQNLAVAIDPPVDVFRPDTVVNGVARPTNAPNAWVAAFDDASPTLTLTWAEPRAIARIELGWDTDFDHPMESSLWGHPECAMPFCVKHYRVRDGRGALLAERVDNHQTRNVLAFDPPVSTDRLVVECIESHGKVPAALFEIRCYGRTE